MGVTQEEEAVSMSEHVSPTAATGRSVTLETGLEAFQSNSEFRGPVEPLEDHAHANDHFALIYESQEEQVAAAIPFIRHGLERGERCLYIADENSREKILDAMWDHGIDVDAALESGSLSVHTKQETYLRNGTFDPDEMIAFLADAIDDARKEYEGLRTTGEMAWIVNDEANVEDLIEYEAKLNRLLSDEDCTSLCQYNRKRFPAEVIRDVISTHPLLVHNGRVSHNVYYTPPEEFFGPQEAEREVDRLLGTLCEQTDAKAELHQRHYFLQDLYAITADQTRSFEEKIHALLDLGCEQFGLDVGGVNRVDPDANHFEVEYLNGDHDLFEPGEEFRLSETYCQAAADIKDAALVSDPTAEGLDEIPVFDEFGIEGYIGTYIPVDGGMDRTLGLLPAESESVSFSEEDRTYLELMGQWFGYELNRHHREQFLRECYQITADPDLTFETKVEHLLELGRDWFDLEMAGLHHLPSSDGKFRLEQGVGIDGDPDDELLITDPSEGAYCRQAIASDEPVGMPDVRGTDWEDDQIYEELGVTSYLGTTVSGGSTPFGTLWFGSTKPRDVPFSEVEHTFLDLMGQWIGYELERRRRECFLRECYEITADPDLSFEEKIEKLLKLGREQFGVEMAGLNHLPSWDGPFRLEKGDGFDVDPNEELWTDPGEGCFCRQTIEQDDPVAMADVSDTDWVEDTIHQQFGLTSYLGTKVMSGATPYGTLWFGSTEPRERPFSETEQTFIELIGQWVSYELDRNDREAQLEQKNDRLESFASMLAHELRNPVAIGQIYSQQLPDEANAEAVEYVTDAFDRIEDMVDVLLILTRGREAVSECTSVDLADAAHKAWDTVESPDAVLDIELDRTIEADETYIRHLFRNLLENAVEHGGPDVTVRAGNLDDGFYVADDGAGIPPEDRDAVFDEGYTTTADNGGTGLGLAFVQKLTEVYEWDITVTESEGGGAQFEFRDLA